MWLDFRAYGLSADELEQRMLTVAKVALDEGKMFGLQGQGFERVNVACPRAILTDCLERMVKAFA